MVTIREVAGRAGVSVATVSHVINGTRKVAPDTVVRVRQAMAELDYHPNAVARSLRTRRTTAIGVLVSDITNPFFATLVRGAEDAASKAGYSLVVCNSDEALEKEDRYIRLLHRRRMDGLLIAPVGDGVSPAIRELVRLGVPFVFVDRRAREVEADAVLSDNEEGAYQAVHHLIERGHRRIGIVLGIPGATTTKERFKGYCRAIEEAGITLSQHLVAWGSYRVEGGRQATKYLLSCADPPTAIFSTNNQMTVGAMDEIRRRGLRVPQDVALVSFDDPDWAMLIDSPLTVVAQQPYRLGREATELLLKRVSGAMVFQPVELRVPVRLIVRGST